MTWYRLTVSNGTQHNDSDSVENEHAMCNHSTSLNAATCGLLCAQDAHASIAERAVDTTTTASHMCAMDAHASIAELQWRQQPRHNLLMTALVGHVREEGTSVRW